MEPTKEGLEKQPAPTTPVGFNPVEIDAGQAIALAVDDYSVAEITVAYERNSKTNARRLILAVFELLPAHLEAAPEGAAKPERLSDDLELNVRRWRAPPAEAIPLYRSCAQGSLSLPPHVQGGRTIPVVVNVEPCDDEPIWPALTLEERPFWGSTPFWGERPGGTRWHRQIPLQPTRIWESWTPTQQEKAASWLESELQIAIASRSVLWGSVHLRLPNPIFSELGQTSSDDGRKIALRLTPYPGRSVQGLQITMREQRPHGSTYAFAMEVGDHTTLLKVPWPTSETSIEVRCPKRGLLYSSPPSTFIQAIQVNLGLITRMREIVSSGKGKNAKPEKLTVPVSLPGEPRLIGTPAPLQSALLRLATDEHEFRTKRRGESGQRWFRAQSQEGAAFVRSLIRPTQKSLFIVDPYFDRYALSFALTTEMAPVAVRVLGSGLHLADSVERGRAAALEKSLTDALKADASLKIEIRVARGQQPIHDRFLVIDEAIWQPGCSLSDFGERGSTIVLLPDPGPVLLDLEQAWAAASTLASFVAEQKALSASRGGFPGTTTTAPGTTTARERLCRAVRAFWSTLNAG